MSLPSHPPQPAQQPTAARLCQTRRLHVQRPHPSQAPRCPARRAPKSPTRRCRSESSPIPSADRVEPKVGTSSFTGVTNNPSRWPSVRQSGTLPTPSGWVGVALAATPFDGTFDNGTKALTALSEWLDDHRQETSSADACSRYDFCDVRGRRDEILSPDNDVHFSVGNQNARRRAFSVLGVWRPKVEMSSS